MAARLFPIWLSPRKSQARKKLAVARLELQVGLQNLGEKRPVASLWAGRDRQQAEVREKGEHHPKGADAGLRAQRREAQGGRERIKKGSPGRWHLNRFL